MSSGIKKKKKPFVPLDFGPLPVDIINDLLGLEIEEGEVRMSINAQKHAARRHPDDYSRCMPHVASILERPLYIGDDFRNPGAIELIGRVSALGGPMLVAVEVEKDGDGYYNVRSFYPIGDGKIQARREKKHLKIVPPQRRTPDP